MAIFGQPMSGFGPGSEAAVEEKPEKGNGWKDGRGAEIRTPDLLVPNQALYQAEPRPECKARTETPEPLPQCNGCAANSQGILTGFFILSRSFSRDLHT